MDGVEAMQAIGVGRNVQSFSLMRTGILLSVMRGGPSSVLGPLSMLIFVLPTWRRLLAGIRQAKSMHVAD